jgi:hypothetical protein
MRQQILFDPSPTDPIASKVCTRFGIPTLCRYAGAMTNRLNLPRLSILAASAIMTVAAQSAEKPTDPQGLPGVRNDYRIVRPMTPEPDGAPASTGRTDGWEVSVSGTITIDISTGNLPPPRH